MFYSNLIKQNANNLKGILLQKYEAGCQSAIDLNQERHFPHSENPLH